MADLMSLSISCVPQFIQFAVAEYLGTNESESFTSNLRIEMKSRLAKLFELVPDGVMPNKPNSAFYALLNTGNKSGDEAFQFLLDKNVSTCPGSKFGENSKNCIRVSLAGNSDNFERDIQMLSVGLRDWAKVNS